MIIPNSLANWVVSSRWCPVHPEPEGLKPFVSPWPLASWMLCLQKTTVVYKGTKQGQTVCGMLIIPTSTREGCLSGFNGAKTGGKPAWQSTVWRQVATNLEMHIEVQLQVWNWQIPLMCTTVDVSLPDVTPWEECAEFSASCNVLWSLQGKPPMCVSDCYNWKQLPSTGIGCHSRCERSVWKALRLSMRFLAYTPSVMEVCVAYCRSEWLWALLRTANGGLMGRWKEARSQWLILRSDTVRLVDADTDCTIAKQNNLQQTDICVNARKQNFWKKTLFYFEL